MNRDQKAKLLLSERRVRILQADETSVVADVLGDSALYRVSAYPEGTALVKECSCTYTHDHHPYAADCSHVLAVLHVWHPDERSVK